ncbi:hypothetical protein BS78_07G128900 [Paspalum vaginatum]|nr:hypothetical protein BS78_07G128900 [Paspalum vaginatum]
MTILEDGIPPVISGHPAHPEHKLKLVTSDDRPFTCDGCMQPGHGAGTRYRCEHERCDFDLHTCCARAEPTLTYPMFRDTTFVFLLEPPEATAGRRGKHGQHRCRVCDACGDVVRGFVYHGFDADLDLHPCCARLPERLVQPDGRVFELQRTSPRPCGMCGASGRRRDFWAYRSRVDGEDVDLHVVCMKEMARLSWDAERQSWAGGGQMIVQARPPAMDRMLQSLPGRTRRSTGFQRFWKLVGAVVSVVIAVIFGNPVVMVAAIAGPGGLLRG